MTCHGSFSQIVATCPIRPEATEPLSAAVIIENASPSTVMRSKPSGPISSCIVGTLWSRLPRHLPRFPGGKNFVHLNFLVRIDAFDFVS